MRSAIRRACRRLTPPAWRGALVLLYHRAAVLDVDPWRLAVTPSHLDEHLEILRRSSHPMTAAALGTAMDSGRIPAGATVVTFDDGYADLAAEVRPRLHAADVPATMFVVSRAIDREREFWWDELERALLGPDRPDHPFHLPLADGAARIDPNAAASAEAFHREVWGRIRRLPPATRDQATESVLRWAGLAVSPARPTHRTLTTAEFDTLVTDDLVELGGHTATHPWLPALTPDGAIDEVDGGRRELEARIGRPILSFAYPHGGPNDLGDGPDAVRTAGFRQAFLATRGLVRTRSPRLALPRLHVDDIDGEAFARLLWRQAGIRVA